MTERLLDFAENVKCKSNEKAIQEWRSGTIQERLTFISKVDELNSLILKKPDLQLQNLSKLSKLT
jgi:5-methyltetrahydrofolate--homocysteine methyltransferase